MLRVFLCFAITGVFLVPHLPAEACWEGDLSVRAQVLDLGASAFVAKVTSVDENGCAKQSGDCMPITVVHLSWYSHEDYSDAGEVTIEYEGGITADGLLVRSSTAPEVFVGQYYIILATADGVDRLVPVRGFESVLPVTLSDGVNSGSEVLDGNAVVSLRPEHDMVLVDGALSAETGMGPKGALVAVSLGEFLAAYSSLASERGDHE